MSIHYLSPQSPDGTVIGTTTSDVVAFYGGTPVTQQTDPGSLTDSSGGTVDGTVAAVSGSGADSTINDNFAELVDRVNALQAALANLNAIG